MAAEYMSRSDEWNDWVASPNDNTEALNEPKPRKPKPERPEPEQPKPEQPKPEEPKPEQPKPPWAKHPGNRQPPQTGDSGITPTSVAVDISKSLPVGVYYLEARVYGFNGPWCWKAAHVRAPFV